MNTFERLTTQEPIKSTEEIALLDIRDQLIGIRALAKQVAGGADVQSEFDEAKEAIFQRLAKAIEDTSDEGELEGKQGQIE